ncbi:hypothetical protein Tco_0236350 [Tanacetum coccineum]
MTRSSTKELFAPLDNPKRVFCSKRRLFETPGLVESSSTEFDLFSDIEECSKEEATEVMAETMKQYTSKTSGDYGSGVTRPKMDGNGHFELKGQFPKELLDNTFSCSEHEDTNEHIEKVLEIVDLFHIQNITQDQIMLRAFPISLTGAASRWLKNEPAGLILTWEILKLKFLSKYLWERFKELLMKCPQHYLTEMQEVILFYNGLDVPTRQLLDSKGAIPTKTDVDQRDHPKTSHSNKKGKPLRKLIIRSLVHPTNLKDSTEQQGQDSTSETNETLRTPIEDQLRRNH